MSERPDLNVIEGSGDVVAFLESMLEKARNGEIEGMSAAYSRTDGHNFVGYAYRDDMQYAWARLVAGADDLHRHLMNGLGDDD